MANEDKENLKIKLLESINNHLKSRNKTSMIEGQMIMKISKHMKAIDSSMQRIFKFQNDFKGLMTSLTLGINDLGDKISKKQSEQSGLKESVSHILTKLDNISSSLELIGGTITHDLNLGQPNQSNPGQGGNNMINILSSINNNIGELGKSINHNIGVLDQDIVDSGGTDDSSDDSDDISETLDNMEDSLNSISSAVDSISGDVNDISSNMPASY